MRVNRIILGIYIILCYFVWHRQYPLYKRIRRLKDFVPQSSLYYQRTCRLFKIAKCPALPYLHISIVSKALQDIYFVTFSKYSE